MKKILALVLAAFMIFSLGVVGFAEGEEDTGILLPEFPTQTEGAIYFASENTYVEAGGIYEIPVYMLSNYTPSVEGDVVIGLTISLVGAAFDNNLMVITDIKPSAEVQALAGYELIAADVNFADELNNNMFIFKTSDMSVLNNAKLPVAIATVEVKPEYTGYNEDGSEMDCMLEVLAANYINYYEQGIVYSCATAPVSIFEPDAQALFDEIYWVDPLESVEFGAADFISGIYTVPGHLIVEPPVPTWEERLKAWAIEQAIKIITFFQGINDVLLGLLPTL
ncbi:MAG: hypothetical protein IKT61_06100 [Clostridia bacterium]|nr:hypothetical protein [Clostridia bacterium]